MDKRLIRVSKYLAKHLRHAPQEPGSMLHPGGWVPVDDLLAAADRNGFPISYDELVDCVETNSQATVRLRCDGRTDPRQPGAQRRGGLGT